ncbi:MAG: DUF3429 domain-containing protein [Pseudomonadota bacterium]
MTTMEQADVPPAALWLGRAGLIPFIGLALATLATEAETKHLALRLLEGYGVVILSFMGGCRWGFAAAGLGEGPRIVPLAIAVLPALFAWAVAELPTPYDLCALAFGFMLLFVADVKLTEQQGAPIWWPRLRLPLTSGAALSLFAGAGATM